MNKSIGKIRAISKELSANESKVLLVKMKGSKL